MLTMDDTVVSPDVVDGLTEAEWEWLSGGQMQVYFLHIPFRSSSGEF